jgi:hypothetical protein
MKYIANIVFTFALLIAGLYASAQYPQNLTGGSDSALTTFKGGLKGRIILQGFADTTAANLQRIRQYGGAQIFTLDSNTVWTRNANATKWIKNLSGANITITNIYDNSIINGTIYNGNCIIINTGAGPIDAVCSSITGLIINSPPVFINDSTMIVCGYIPPDTITVVCDTLHFPPHALYIYDNGLTQVSAGHVEGGGVYNHNTGFDANYYVISNYTRAIQNYGWQYKQYQNWNNSSGIASFTNSTNTSVRYGMNWADSTWRTVAQGGFVPGPNHPYRGLWFGGNGTYQIGQPQGYLLADDIRRPSVGMFLHEDTSGVAFDLYGIKWANAGSGSGSTTNSITNSKIISGYINGRVQFPQYVNISDANTDSAFYKGADGTMKYGKVNSGTTYTGSQGILKSTNDFQLGVPQGQNGLPFSQSRQINLLHNNLRFEGDSVIFRIDVANTSIFNGINQSTGIFSVADIGNSYQYIYISPGEGVASFTDGNGNGLFIGIGSGYATLNNSSVTLSSLAGTGSRTVIANASGLLSAPVSDRSVKEKIQNLHNALSIIGRLRPRTYFFKEGWKNYGEGMQFGFVAQEIQQVLPNSVYINPNGKMGYNETDIIPILVKAVQEQQKEIEQLKKEVIKLKSKK